MATYILLMNMTETGRRKMLSNTESMLAAAHDIDVPDTDVLGLYAALGEYDFVGIVSAPGNEEAAQFSLHLGVNAGVQVTTLPAIPIGRLGESGAPDDDDEVTSRGIERESQGELTTQNGH